MSEATDKMQAEGLPDIAITTFAHYERLLGEGDLGTLPEAELEPLDDVQGSDDLPGGAPADLERAVVLKLNGGLGTSMGMTKAKSLARGQGRADLPRRDRAPGAAPARAPRRGASRCS